MRIVRGEEGIHMRFLRRIGLLVLIVAVAFACGLFASTQDIFAVLLGNIRSSINVESVLTDVQQLSQLTSIRYTYENRITASREVPALLAIAYGQELTMEAVGYVNAGVDLSTMTTADITLQGGVLQVVLPSAQLQDCFFNENESRIVDQRSALFAQYSEDLQIAARRIAIDRFRASALENGILDDARAQAEAAVGALLGLAAPVTVTEIRVISQPPDPNAPLPATCQ
jgi:hypothetical protein